VIPAGGNRRPAGFEMVRVTVTTVADDGTCLTRDTIGRERQVRYDLRPKGTGVPAGGEIWLIRKMGDTWVLGAQVGAARPVVTGDRSAGTALVSLLAALVELGLIEDETVP
jgi:hypothetical protein